jgi:hypothetical protein
MGPYAPKARARTAGRRVVVDRHAGSRPLPGLDTRLRARLGRNPGSVWWTCVLAAADLGGSGCEGGRGLLVYSEGDEQRDHHRRIMRRRAMTIHPVTRVERVEIKISDRLRARTRQVPLRQPLPQDRRQQQLLITITSKEVLALTPSS